MYFTKPTPVAPPPTFSTPGALQFNGLGATGINSTANYGLTTTHKVVIGLLIAGLVLYLARGKA